MIINYPLGSSYALAPPNTAFGGTVELTNGLDSKIGQEFLDFAGFIGKSYNIFAGSIGKSYNEFYSTKLKIPEKATLSYPLDLQYSNTNQDWILFEFYDYRPPYHSILTDVRYNSAGVTTYNASTNTYTPYDSANTPTTPGSVYLSAAEGFSSIAFHMPSDVQTSYLNNWQGIQFGPLGPAGLKAGGDFLNGSPGSSLEDFGHSLAKIFTQNGVGQSLQALSAGVTAGFMNFFPGFGGSVGTNDVLGAAVGKILNPNTEVTYQGPQLRTFQFDYHLWARNPKEAEEIKQILLHFKLASLPSLGSDTISPKNPKGLTGNNQNSSVMIGVPKVIKMTFMTGNKKNDNVTQYKTSALSGVQINYAPNGVWTTYTDGNPVGINLTLQFQELKLVYAEDVAYGF